VREVTSFSDSNLEQPNRAEGDGAHLQANLDRLKQEVNREQRELLAREKKLKRQAEEHAGELERLRRQFRSQVEERGQEMHRLQEALETTERLRVEEQRTFLALLQGKDDRLAQLQDELQRTRHELSEQCQRVLGLQATVDRLERCLADERQTVAHKDTLLAERQTCANELGKEARALRRRLATQEHLVESLTSFPPLRLFRTLHHAGKVFGFRLPMLGVLTLLDALNSRYMVRWERKTKKQIFP